jgi:group I intron endonuclease
VSVVFCNLWPGLVRAHHRQDRLVEARAYLDESLRPAMWVYKLTNVNTGKAYIGQTRKKLLRQRLSGHKNAHKYRDRGCRLLNNAIRKHGWDAFKVEVLGRPSTLEGMDAMEEAMIKEHGTQSPGGYNILDGPAKTPGANPVVKAKRAETMKAAEPRRKISVGVAQAWQNCTEEERAVWVENVRLAQTTPDALANRSLKQSAARARKSEAELADWNRRSAEGMQARAAVYREQKLATMAPEEGRKWLARLEATRKCRAANPKSKRTSSKFRPFCASEEDHMSYLATSDDEDYGSR